MTQADEIKQLDSTCLNLVQYRKRPLLILYYPAMYAWMTQSDVDDAYREFRAAGWRKEQKLPALDLLLHTYGGDPVAAYRLAQMIRSFTDHLAVLVPMHAYSGGTLLSFAGDEIRLGDFAGLSPIDITLAAVPSPSAEEVELATVDYFMEFAQQAREATEKILEKLGSKRGSSVDSELLVQMVKEVGALKVGKYFRERTLTGYYAEVLLDTYMFKSAPDGDARRNAVIRHFLMRAPAHEFHMDYHLCAKRKLAVREVPTQESDLSKEIVRTLGDLTSRGIICQDLGPNVKIPFIRFYELKEDKNGGKKPSGEGTGNAQKAPGDV